MKTSTLLWIFSAVWLGFGVLGLVVGSDNALIIGLVNSTVNVVGSQVAKLIEKKESK